MSATMYSASSDAMASMARKAVRGKPSKTGHNVSPSLYSIVKAFRRDGQDDREMLLALLHAKRAEDERLAVLSYTLAFQTLAYASAGSQQILPKIHSLTDKMAAENAPDSPSSVSSERSSRSSVSDDESATSLESANIKSSKVPSRKRKTSPEASSVCEPVPPVHHSQVMNALREKLKARAEPSLPNQDRHVDKRPRSTSQKRMGQSSIHNTPHPTVPVFLEPTASTKLPSGSALFPRNVTGPTESEKFRASLNLLNMAAEQSRESLVGNSWQTSDVRGQ